MTSTNDMSKVQTDMLEWYDKQGRSLPWRAKGNETPNAYHVWLSEIMCQQTTIQAVIPYFMRFIEKWPSVHNLAKAEQDDVMHEWAGLGYYARARNLHKCARVVSAEYGGQFPNNRKDLMELPGIGDYTSAAMASIVFDKAAPVIDGNVERVSARFFAFQGALPSAKPKLKKQAEELYSNNKDRHGDLAQAYMDLGATICTPKSPKCMICPIRERCSGHKLGIAPELPKKEAKKAKPKRYGHYYWITNADGDVLFQRRAEDRMMGGMLALPTTDWDLKKETSDLELTNIEDLSENHTVKHSFTHFDLELRGFKAKFEPKNGDFKWIKVDEIHNLGVPSLFKKAVKLMI